MGPHCEAAIHVMNSWSSRSGASQHTLAIGYLSWFPLLAGVVAVLRGMGRGRCGWEPATVIGVACLPPVWMCVESTTHPEGLLAMGFGLVALALAWKQRWLGSGAFVGLALLSQPFAVLIAVPLFVIAPRRSRLQLAGACAAVVILVAVPLALVGSRTTHYGFLHQLRDGIINGSANVVQEGTFVWDLHLSGTELFVVSRVVPVVLVLALSAWVVRNLGPTATQPEASLALVSIAMGVRLLFEETLYGYYFMALAVSLVLLEVAGRRMRGAVVGWVLLVTILFGVKTQPTPIFHLAWSNTAQNFTMAAVLVAALGMGTLSRVKNGWGLGVVVWSVVFLGVVLNWQAVPNLFQFSLPIWFWQIVLVGSAMILAAVPLRAKLLEKGAPELTMPAPNSA